MLSQSDPWSVLLGMCCLLTLGALGALLTAGVDEIRHRHRRRHH